MKKLFLSGALIAAALAPVAVQAQDNRPDRHEMQGDRRDRQQDRREVHQDRRELQSDRRDLQSDRRDLRHDRGDAWRGRNDGRHDGRPGYRADYRRGGNWNAPFAYRAFGIGAVVPGGYWGSRYYVNDWQRFRLPPPQYGFYRYVRHYGDVLLINTRNGRVVRVYRNFYR